MVAQMLMQPIQRASENLGGGPFGIGADAGGSYFVDPEVAARTGYGTAVTGTSFFPGAGIVDAYGGAVDVTGQPLPSFGQNIRQGNYLDAALQGLGVAGDVATFAAPATLGTSALVGAMLKAPRAASKYKFENPIKVYQGRSKKGIKDFINPTDFYGNKKVSFGTNELVTAEQFANKQTVYYPGRARDGSEGPTKTTLIPGDVAELEFDIQNPLEVNRKDIGWKRDNEKAAIAEARAKGHDGLKIVYDNSDKIDYVALDSEQVRVVNPSLYPDRDYDYSPTSGELPDGVGSIAKVEPPTETKPGIIAFHGSGADFDEFRLDKIGTGEGAQAFGYGLYFSDSEDIGNFYKRQLTGSSFETKDGKIFDPYTMDNDGQPIIKNPNIRTSIADSDGDIDKPIARAEKIIANMPNTQASELAEKDLVILRDLKAKGGLTVNKGKTYKVAIQPKPEELLDYDLPLSEQSPKVKKAIESLGMNISPKMKGSQIYEHIGSVLKEPPFDSSISNTANFKTSKKVSEKLNSLGIKGLKFKSGQLSGIKDSEATNFVIFDDKLIKILEKYGIVGPVAVSATAAALRDDDGST